MTGRTTAAIVADLRRLPTIDLPDGRFISGYEAADRLTELDEKLGNTDAIFRFASKKLKAIYDKLPDCPTCDGTRIVTTETRDDDEGRGEVLIRTSSIRCPDCVDGKVTIEQLAATWRAVHNDPRADATIAAWCLLDHLRSVKP